jgi:DnaD/phage-associated family protein
MQTVEAYASSNLQHMTPGNMEELASFKADLPDDVICYGIDEACGSGAPRWAYVRRVLQSWVEAGIKTIGDAKEAKAKRQADKQGKTQLDRNPKDNPALNYAQRDYKEEDFGDDFFFDAVKAYGSN